MYEYIGYIADILTKYIPMILNLKNISIGR